MHAVKKWIALFHSVSPTLFFSLRDGCQRPNAEARYVGAAAFGEQFDTQIGCGIDDPRDGDTPVAG